MFTCLPVCLLVCLWPFSLSVTACLKQCMKRSVPLLLKRAPSLIFQFFCGHILISLEDQLWESDGLLLLEVERGVSMGRQTTQQRGEALWLRPLPQSIPVINATQTTQNKLESLVLWLVFLDVTESKACCKVCSAACPVSVGLEMTLQTDEGCCCSMHLHYSLCLDVTVLRREREIDR